MLGRFKHEGANVTISPRGQASPTWATTSVFEYIYKFVSRDTYRADSSAGVAQAQLTLLDGRDPLRGEVHRRRAG